MKMKKAGTLFVAFTMLATTFVGCTGNGSPTDAKDDVKQIRTENSNKDSASTNKEEAVTLKWIQVGGGMPDNYDAWKKHMDEYLADKINVNIDVEVVPWGDWDNRRNVIVNSGEYYDILFTDGTRYNAAAKLGAFLDITDLVKTETPDLYGYIPEDYWKAVSVNGKIYSVPTYKDSSASQFFVWDKGIVDKYNIDYQSKNSLADLTDDLKRVKDGEGSAPFVLNSNGADVICSTYDQMGIGLPAIGVKYNDESRKVVSVFEQKDVLEQLNVLHQWYEEGIINADAPALAETPNYRMVFTAQGWPSAAKTTWGPNMGVEAVASQFGDTIVSNDTVRGSLNGIYAGSEHPKKALEFLQLVNLDSYVRDAFYYGLEGENFKYTKDGSIEKLNSDWKMAGYTQGTFFTLSQLADAKVNQWDEVKELNANAKPSVLLGFTMDTNNVETELANCRAVYEKYRSELLTGAKDPIEQTATLKKELESAGFKKLLAEAQKQIDAVYK